MKIVKIKQGQTSTPIKLFNIIYPKGKISLDKIILNVKNEYQSEVDSRTIKSVSLLVEDINRLDLNGFGTYFARGLIEKSLANNLATKLESTNS